MKALCSSPLPRLAGKGHLIRRDFLKSRSITTLNQPSYFKPSSLTNKFEVNNPFIHQPNSILQRTNLNLIQTPTNKLQLRYNATIPDEHKMQQIQIKQEGKEIGKEIVKETRADFTRFTHELQEAKGFKEKVKFLWHFAKEITHKLWIGARGLWHNTLEAYKLRRKKKSGEILTRQEERFIRQNKMDLQNLLPFFLIWRIPIFGDFILPIFIAKFPELLPSTFKLMKKPTIEQVVRNAKLKQLSLLSGSNQIDTSSLQLVHHMQSAIEGQSDGVSAHRLKQYDDLLEFYFGDASRLSTKQISAVLTRLTVGTRAPSFFLRRRLTAHLEYIRGDDKLLEKEGLEKLSEKELYIACLERGLKVLHLSVRELKEQLTEWFKLTEEAPHVQLPLWIYAHAFYSRDVMLRPDQHSH